jgi:hypothetical protein
MAQLTPAELHALDRVLAAHPAVWLVVKQDVRDQALRARAEKLMQGAGLNPDLYLEAPAPVTAVTVQHQNGTPTETVLEGGVWVTRNLEPPFKVIGADG